MVRILGTLIDRHQTEEHTVRFHARSHGFQKIDRIRQVFEDMAAEKQIVLPLQ